ncbi:MarR family winged helix-turn-helix transcriptional regulator [Frankia sp. R82]|uniref:MarR family winged helix-turn-helix transcriptional regulator n=1 Tax=Frankia sp. R82 TaxID=2950553 RepID=UPI002044AB91|nr:MarR family winged helix-turn-helix transcriptional regulator [Frankia sp. R82]MCM3883019.1 MarR family winged helix-turn-helix transcriptional regulator [Frankia sp. R82]
MPPPETGDEVVDLVLAAGHRVRVAVDEALRAGVGLTLRRFKILGLLADTGPCRLRDLADAVRVAPRTMTATVDELESAGLIERRAHPHDRRAVLVALTPTGRTTLDEGRRCRNETVTGITHHLDRVQRAQLAELLTSIVSSAPPARMPTTTKDGLP